MEIPILGRKMKFERFEFDWKSYFIEKKELTSFQKNYYYGNLIVEKDPIQWNYQTIWYGKSTNQHKISPECLQEDMSEAELSQILLKRKNLLSPLS